jgi:hypothetical protein
MQERIETLIAKDEIRDLVVTLARAMDRNDSDGILSCYHPGAFDYHGEFEGPVEQLVGFIESLHRDRVAAMYHLLGNHLITVDGDTGLGELYITALLRTKGDEPFDMIAGGRYLDRYLRREGQWRLAERRVVMDWQRFDPVGSLPAVATVEVKQLGLPKPHDLSYEHFASLGARVER